MEGLFDSIIIAGRVLRDKCWYGLWHFDLHKSVKRIYPKEPYYDSLNNLLASKPSYIIDNIFLGNAFNAADYKWLKDNKIEIIVNVTPSISNYFPDEFEYHNINVIDLNSSSLKSYYDRFYDLVEESEGHIFVHCFAGKSRSAVLVLYYLMKKYSWDFDTAIDILKVKRPCININTSFVDELKGMFDDVAYF